MLVFRHLSISVYLEWVRFFHLLPILPLYTYTTFYLPKLPAVGTYIVPNSLDPKHYDNPHIYGSLWMVCIPRYEELLGYKVHTFINPWSAAARSFSWMSAPIHTLCNAEGLHLTIIISTHTSHNSPFCKLMVIEHYFSVAFIFIPLIGISVEPHFIYFESVMFYIWELPMHKLWLFFIVSYCCFLREPLIYSQQ